MTDERPDATRTTAAETRHIAGLPPDCRVDLIAFRHDPRLLAQQPFPTPSIAEDLQPCRQFADEFWRMSEHTAVSSTPWRCQA